MMLIETVWIFAVAAVRRSAAGLDVCHAIRLRPQYAKERFRVHGSRTDLNIIWLLKYAILIGPEFFKLQK